ncbi:VOC family protein [Bacillus sp. S10(2024)]|uniref:VOC family protein n=1 Tax=Bacillus sp. S10(2024) TaxID=3162886 RepID=UPI003D19F133
MEYSYIGIDHVQLAAPAGSEMEARTFFGKILGMQEITKPLNLAKRGGVWFTCGKHQLHIGIQKDFSPALKAHPAFHINNLAALHDHLIKNGIVVKKEEPLEGAIRFFVDDPFGNRIEFIEWLK